MAQRIRPHSGQLNPGTEAVLPLPFYFISDVHISPILNESEQQRRRVVCRLFEEIRHSKGTLFILGDFFDFWFDFGEKFPNALRECVQELRSLRAAGIPVHYVSGNHDYWIEGFLTQSMGLIPYEDHIDFIHHGKRFYLTHGDGLLKDDTGYRLMKKILRSRFAIYLLSLLGMERVYRIGKKISRTFAPISDEKLEITEGQAAEMKQYLDEKLKDGYDFAMMGHVHFPLRTEWEGRTGLILGDWVLPGHQWFARWNGKVLEHKNLL